MVANLPFGKFKNVPLSEVPEHYLLWLLDQSWPQLWLLNLVRREIESRTEDRPQATRNNAALAIPARYRPHVEEIVRRGFRAASLHHHPDQGGKQETFVELKAAHEWLLERI
jgi:hypothetical protein